MHALLREGSQRRGIDAMRITILDLVVGDLDHFGDPSLMGMWRRRSEVARIICADLIGDRSAPTPVTDRIEGVGQTADSFREIRVHCNGTPVVLNGVPRPALESTSAYDCIVSLR